MAFKVAFKGRIEQKDGRVEQEGRGMAVLCDGATYSDGSILLMYLLPAYFAAIGENQEEIVAGIVETKMEVGYIE